MCLQAIILSVEQKQLQETELIFHCATDFSSKHLKQNSDQSVIIAGADFRSWKSLMFLDAR